MTSKRALAAFRNMSWEEAKNLKCLRCLDSCVCQICQGAKVVPEPHGASIRPVKCWNCNGTGICPDCSIGSPAA